MTAPVARSYRHILMDWDGTTSLIRAGWADLMVALYVDQLPVLPGEDTASRHKLAWDEIMRLNGRPSIHQAARLVELVTERAGQPLTAIDYQADFQNRLEVQRQARLAPLRVAPTLEDHLLVPGVRAFFSTLQAQGMKFTLATGTPMPQILEEAALLGLDHFFEGRIYGPEDTHDTAFSKRDVIARLLTEQHLSGSELMAFGDGPVEIAETVAVGGYAVAVASDEAKPGRLDELKRDLLLGVGAHAVIADYHGAPPILRALGW